MANQDAKTKTSEDANCKTESQKHAHGWGPIFSGGMAEMFSGSWLQNLLISLALLLIWPAIGAFVMKTQKAFIIGFGIGTTILIWIAVIISARQVDNSTPAPSQPSSSSPSLLPSPSPSISMSPSSSPSPSPGTEKPKLAAKPVAKRAGKVPSIDAGARSHESPFKWTDYTEAYFLGAIWRWQWRPEMGDRIARNITGLCPECDGPLKYGEPFVEEDKRKLFILFCGKHIHKTYYLHSPSYDPRDGIQELISKSLQDGSWEKIVRQQREAE